MLALLPVSIPDCILDFLEDFTETNILEKVKAKSSLEPAFLQQNEILIKQQLEALKSNAGSITQVHAEAIGKEMPGAYLCKIVFENGIKGIGFNVKLKENVISKIVTMTNDYNVEELKKQLAS